MPFAFTRPAVRALACVALVLGLAAPGDAADAPRRVVSFNVCADQLVLALAEPDQIAALSPNAADPAQVHVGVFQSYLEPAD